ncbi:MAG TPA: nucleoside-diphosphate sugar epimerase/dehydratase [Pseudonocardia sp.]|nr:nucleoside-diphosphate sugar epimerase/dehydratase [Pseudonocardia sp.]
MRSAVPPGYVGRRLALMAWDCVAWAFGLTAAIWMRYEGDTSMINRPGLAVLVIIAIVAHLLLALPLRLYRGRYRVGGADGAIALCAVMGLVGCSAMAVVLVPGLAPVPRSVPAIGTLVAIAAAVGARLAVRLLRERSARPDARSALRVIVLGSGVEGQQLVKSMITDPGSGYRPVALLDDDPERRHLSVYGVSVRGTRHDLAEVAARTGADHLVVAARDLGSAEMDEVSRAAVEAGLGVKVLPPLEELLRPLDELLQPNVVLSDLRDLDITDLLGRLPVEIDVAAIAGYLTGRRVLVTGAGGSIGSELCRQIHRFEPAELIMLDRDESGLHATQLSITGSALLDSSDVVLADIRDADVLAELFARRRPEVVFHAAALKHLPVLERFPDEAWRTNVLGTQNVLDAARIGGATTFVNISTDKAANPISVLGRSKRIGEQLVAEASEHSDGTYVSVRFGNVLGSRGSVLTTFTEQIAAGGPLTVTHPDVTRFLMTISEAAQLVVHAAAIGRPGEVLVLDMGGPVRIVDLAQQLMRLTERTVDIVYTGLRGGEKLHEELLGDGEVDHRPIHPAVSHIPAPPLQIRCAIEYAARLGSAQAMVHLLQLPAPTLALAPVMAAGHWAPAQVFPRPQRVS